MRLTVVSIFIRLLLVTSVFRKKKFMYAHLKTHLSASDNEAYLVFSYPFCFICTE